MSLLVIDTHPVQYRSPLYRYLNNYSNLDIKVIYGSNFSISGYKDVEFNEIFKWDINLLDGYYSEFLSKIEDGGAKNF